MVFLWAVNGPPIAMKMDSSNRMMTARLEAVKVVVTLDELRPWWCLIRNA